MRLSRVIRVVAGAILTPLIFTACAHTSLPAQVVMPAPVGTAKLPLKVVVLADPSLTLHEPLGFYEKLNPALANTIRDALAADFDRVEVVENRLSAGDTDLLAIPATEVHYFNIQPVKLTVSFFEQKTGKTVAEISSVKPIDPHAPGTNVHLVTDTAIMFTGPLIVLLEPTLQQHDSERFNAAFSPALLAMATDIAARASKDQTIRSLATR